ERMLWLEAVVIARSELVRAEAEGRTGRLDAHRVTARPAGADSRAAGDLEVARQRRALVTDVDVALFTIVPEVDRLGHPTGEGHRDLLVALADGRCFQFRHPLLEIRAAVAPEVCSFGRIGAHGETAKRHAKCSCDGDAAGCFCQSPKHVHLHLP